MCAKCNKCKEFEKRIERLESIMTPNSLTLINKQDTTEQIVFEYDGEYKIKKLKTTVTEEVLGSSEGL